MRFFPPKSIDYKNARICYHVLFDANIQSTVIGGMCKDIPNIYMWTFRTKLQSSLYVINITIFVAEYTEHVSPNRKATRETCFGMVKTVCPLHFYRV